MAVFNPETSRINPDFTGASKGQIPDRSFASLFQGVGEGITGALQVADSSIQQNIREDVYDIYDNLNDDFGIDASVNEAQDAIGQQGVPPKQLQDSLGHLSLLSRAFANGDLKSYHYWGRLENEVRNLRSKYPGYREVIDQTVQSITGATPANALRRNLLAEFDALASQDSDNNKKKFSWVLENQEFLSPGTADAWASDPDGMYEVARAEIQRRQAQQQEMKSNKSQLELKKSLGEDVSGDALKEGIRQQDIIYGELFHDVRTAFGRDYNDFKTKTTEFMADGIVDAEEKQMLLQLSQQVRESYRQAINDVWSTVDDSGESLNTMVSDRLSDRDRAISDAMEKVDFVLNSVIEGKAGILNWNQAMIDGITSADQLGSLKRDEIFRKALLIKNTFGDQWLNFLQLSHPEFLSATVDAIVGSSMVDILGTSPEEVSALTDYVENIENVLPDSEQAVAVRQLIENALTTLVSSEAPVGLSKTAASTLFRPENNGFLTNFTPGDRNENWVRLFSEIASPEVTKKMKALGTENPELWNNYKTWVFDKWPALFSPHAVELNKLRETSQNAIQFAYNPDVNEFFAVIDQQSLPQQPNPESLTFSAPIINNPAAWWKEQSEVFTAPLNEYLNMLNPIMDADSMDKSVTVRELMDSLGVQEVLYTDQEPGETTEGRNLEGEGDTTPVPSGNPFLGFVGDAEGTDRGRGYNETLGYGAFTGGDVELISMDLDAIDELQGSMLADPNNTFNSSALGRYQIVRKTLRRLREKLDLDGSELFDEKLQDRLATELAKERGRDVSGLRNEWEGFRFRPASQILEAFDQL